MVVFLSKNPFTEEEMFFRVEKGQGSREIALSLEKQGFIWWGPVFRLYVLTTGVSDKLQAGTYQFSPSMNISVIAGKLASGDIAQEEITIIEGWNLKDIAWYFENKGMFQAEELFELNQESWQGGLEGYLFPDTYLISRGDSLAEIVEQMQDNFDKRTINLEITPDIITMASLIEKEVRTKEDKEIVSGILWKRLRVGMPLQVDATIVYITGANDSGISKQDTQIDSPYNTYLYRGLPAGPISNPGIESISAAVYPKDSQYWYYLSTPEGETIFSKTLQEHNIAKAKYLK